MKENILFVLVVAMFITLASTIYHWIDNYHDSEQIVVQAKFHQHTNVDKTTPAEHTVTLTGTFKKYLIVEGDIVTFETEVESFTRTQELIIIYTKDKTYYWTAKSFKADDSELSETWELNK